MKVLSVSAKDSSFEKSFDFPSYINDHLLQIDVPLESGGDKLDGKASKRLVRRCRWNLESDKLEKCETVQKTLTNWADELAKGPHKIRIATLFDSSNETVAWRWNTTCPNSGKPVPRDREDCFFEHEGVRVYFCNPHCASDGAKDPEAWIAKVYPDGPPAAIK